METKSKQGKLDTELLLKGIEQGMTKVDAGRFAGLKAKHDSTIIHTINKRLANNEPLKKNMIERLELHRDRIIEALGDKDMDKEPSGTLNLMLCQVIDKIQLLSGSETERIGIRPIVTTIIDTEAPKRAQIESPDTYKEPNSI